MRHTSKVSDLRQTINVTDLKHTIKVSDLKHRSKVLEISLSAQSFHLHHDKYPFPCNKSHTTTLYGQSAQHVHKGSTVQFLPACHCTGSSNVLPCGTFGRFPQQIKRDVVENVRVNVQRNRSWISNTAAQRQRTTFVFSDADRAVFGLRTTICHFFRLDFRSISALYRAVYWRQSHFAIQHNWHNVCIYCYSEYNYQNTTSSFVLCYTLRPFWPSSGRITTTNTEKYSEVGGGVAVILPDDGQNCRNMSQMTNT